MTELSIVIPAWKESERLPISLGRICEYLTQQKLVDARSEIVIVLEACEDRETTRTGIESQRIKFPEINIRTIDNEQHCGKGYTVKKGILAATGDVILMTDADLSTPIEELMSFWSIIKDNGYDCVIGERTQVIKQPPHRKLMGWGFRNLTRLILGLPFYDTQCGFKLFTNSFGKDVFNLVEIPGFGFDIEMLAIGLQLNYKIAECKVQWYDDARTTVNPVVDSLKMFKNLLEVKNKISKFKK